MTKRRRSKANRAAKGAHAAARMQGDIVRGSGETRAIEALTVGWMLSVMATIGFLLGFVMIRIYLAAAQPVEQLVVSFGAFADILFLAAIVSGLASLVLAAVVCRNSQTRPPLAIIRGAVSIGLLPLLIVLVRIAIA
ncbi:MAG: hypothetical protein SGJ20_20700 [Planctomycetota bacterium]|nr:hypothetical protein [Planctomycetota bacterium]